VMVEGRQLCLELLHHAHAIASLTRVPVDYIKTTPTTG